MINVKKLRCFIGWLAMLLPWIVVILSLAFGYSFPESISATYYRDECIVPFMIILGSAGVLLICYDGYDKQDRIICTIAGIFGLMICIFPCSTYPNNVGLNSAELIGTFHLPAVASG